VLDECALIKVCRVWLIVSLIVSLVLLVSLTGLAAMAALVCLTVRIGVGALLVGLVAKLKGN
jgi:hypothetical protein